MAQNQYVSNFNIPGLDLYHNPMYYDYAGEVMANDGKLIKAVNVKSIPLGAKTKREGYVTFLGTTTNGGSQIQSLFQWIKNDGTTNILYSYAGGLLSYYDAGVGTQTDWLICGNGTFSGTHIGHSVLNNTLIIGDGVGSTRHSTNGTSFTNTTGAPSSEFFEQYQNRIFTTSNDGGTLVYSVTSDPTNWASTGTSDGNSLTVPGAGKINKLFKTADLLHIAKARGQIFRWDGQTLYDMTTNLAPSSPYSVGTVEDNAFWINRFGMYLCDGNGPQLISNPIVKYFYNQAATGIIGTAWGTAPAGIKRYDYYVAVGSVQDDFTTEGVNNAVLHYNFQKNEFLVQQYNDAPTAFTNYIDVAGSVQLLFGNSTGQVFKASDTTNTDNGNPIASEIQMVFTANSPWIEKDWRWIWIFTNPGCEAQIQVALASSFTKAQKNWIDIGQNINGVTQYRFPTGARSRLLFLRIHDSGRTAPWTFYGVSLSFVPKDPG